MRQRAIEFKLLQSNYNIMYNNDDSSAKCVAKIVSTGDRLAGTGDITIKYFR